MDVENSLHKKVVRFLEHLDLSPEQAAAYISLLRYGPQTVLSLSRSLKTGRTKLYPLLEDLTAKQLVVMHERHYGTSYEASSPETLELLVAEKEQAAAELRGQLKVASHTLKQWQLGAPTTSRIVEYQGSDGFKQMNWNQTKSLGDVRILRLPLLAKHLGAHFTEKLQAAMSQKNITALTLTNDRDQLATHNARYINSTLLTINYEMYIYNNCVGIINHTNNEMSGVEVYNEQFAHQQRQFFDLIWHQASLRE